MPGCGAGPVFAMDGLVVSGSVACANGRQNRLWRRLWPAMLGRIMSHQLSGRHTRQAERRAGIRRTCAVEVWAEFPLSLSLRENDEGLPHGVKRPRTPFLLSIRHEPVQQVTGRPHGVNPRRDRA